MAENTKLDIVLMEFLKLSKVPRPSHHEEKIGTYLMNWAEEHNLACYQDELGDVIIDKPAYPGYEKSPKVILQAHMDMVCVAREGVVYDPLNDPIKVIRQGNTLSAEGTSLGADDGIGVALCLYVLQDDSLKHGPLRVIITVNEEDGMTSAGMAAEHLDGKYLINLDWEMLGSLCNSSAGCDFLKFVRPSRRTAAPSGWVTMKITLKGLQGGHSGVGINLGRANAIVSLATLLCRIDEAGIPYKLVYFNGGQAKNAIPNSAEVEIAFSVRSTGALSACIEEFQDSFEKAFLPQEPDYKLLTSIEETPDLVLCDNIRIALLKLLVNLPNGVNTMSPYVSSLVESSQNIGLISTDGREIVIEGMERSCVDYRADELLRTSRHIAEAWGFKYIPGDHAPSWAVNAHSRLVPITCEVYKDLTGEEMAVEPVHGGLECGAFYEKNPHLDMIAIGPTLQNVHSPDETCDIPSVGVTVDLIVEVLKRIL